MAMTGPALALLHAAQGEVLCPRACWAETSSIDQITYHGKGLSYSSLP